MKLSVLFASATLCLGIGLTLPQTAEAADEKPKNLKVLEFNGKDFKKGMKLMTKGLGVKCKACHIKGKYESDEMKEKLAGREFLEATVGKKDADARKAALAKLLKEMKIEKPRDDKQIWAGVDKLKAK